MNLVIANIALSVIMLLIIVIMINKVLQKTFTDQSKVKKKTLILVTSLVLWHIYHFAMHKTGILQDFSLPPRFVLVLVMPAFIFTGIFLYKNRNNEWIKNIPSQWLVFFQTFRIAVETLFVFAVTAGILHPNVTIEGYNYDMVMGVTAPIVGLIMLQNKKLGRRIALIWNYLGLAVLASVVFVFLTTTLFPGFYGSDVPLMPMEFATYPYILVAGFLMPAAVFVHILSIMNLRKTK